MAKERLVEGLWDCSYCGRKGIGGLTKTCPDCGHPQDKDVTFYLPDQNRYLSEDEEQKVGKNPDWVCDYCGALNNAKQTVCSGCCAPREKNTKDYFTAKDPDRKGKETSDTYNEPKDDSESKSVMNQSLDTDTAHKSSKQNTKWDWKATFSILGIILAMLVAIGGLYFLFKPRTSIAEITDKMWSRSVEIEAYKTIQESGWSIPSGGRLQYQQEEIYTYTSVLDHYETVSEVVYEQVLDGYDEQVSYEDNGNGTFSEVTTRIPRYRTESHMETHQEPVYKQVPVYQTKYYYDIDKWVYDHEEIADGHTDTPHDPEYELGDKERDGSKSEVYKLYMLTKKEKKYQYALSEEEWAQYKIGDEVIITTSAGFVTDVKKSE